MTRTGLARTLIRNAKDSEMRKLMAMMACAATGVTADWAGTNDGLHPNGKGYEIMEGARLPFLTKVGLYKQAGTGR